MSKKAQANKETAKINNETKIMNANTDAEVNRTLQQSITPQLLEKMAIEKWDGKLPQVSGGATPFINLTK